MFKSQEFLDESNLVDGENYVFLGDNSVKSSSFLEKYRLPFTNLLLPYFQKFKSAGYNITNIPESIKEQSRKYMEQSDQLYTWFNDSYKKTGEKTDVLKLKDVFAELKESGYYLNLTKQNKRKLTYASLIEYVEKSPLLRMFYKEWVRINKVAYRNILIGFVQKDGSEQEYI